MRSARKFPAPSADNAAWTTPEELTAAILYLLSDATMKLGTPDQCGEPKLPFVWFDYLTSYDLHPLI